MRPFALDYETTQTTWLSLDRQHFRSCVGHVVDVVYPKVLDMEDI